MHNEKNNIPAEFNKNNEVKTNIINEETIKRIKDIVGSENVKLNESMSKHTSFKVGGNADCFITLSDISKLESVIRIAKADGVPINVIGNGTNLLVKDNGIRGITIKITANKYGINNDEVYVEAGVLNAVLAQALLKNNLSGFEFASGIPGTIGGAIVMNAGCFGSEFKDIVKEVTFLDLDEIKIYTISRDECKFEYRNSAFESKNAIIINAILKFQYGENSVILSKMNEFREKRISSQPYEFPNAGSTFKRGDGYITAKLIDEAGLKGFSIGGAEVSEKHAGFIVNKGNATAKDILDLIDYVKRVIKEKYNIEIKEEIRVMGEN